ncbi:uncharacterized protein LOC111695413 [Eurytemora carolleeae]|uniref:uncharacterized protein LOC111695413 n=1 Tax=Eurytemora carolleeae TaxID=1294199 RepID=UPI000C76E9BC|nr:uncharacterized protein LOC111695413 [Eurytemora carolleeae]|eukprot:XP_023320503.1 uncharacterized protein LOC111695413 [Eurytemora affinis]
MSLDLINLNLALFGGKEGEVSLLDLQSGQSSIVIPSIKYSMDRFRKALKFHQGSVDSLKYSQDEKLVITGGEDRQVRLWNIIKSEESFRLSEFQEIDTIREHCEYINSVCVHENTIFSSSGDVNVLIHEYPWREGYGPKPSKQPLVHQQEQDSEVMKVEFEKFLALVGECKAVAEKETGRYNAF